MEDDWSSNGERTPVLAKDEMVAQIADEGIKFSATNAGDLFKKFKGKKLLSRSEKQGPIIDVKLDQSGQCCSPSPYV